MKLLDIIKEDNLISILTKYSYEENDIIIKQLDSWSEIISSEEFILPVLGIQGAGKSSLLNALLMDDIVLPVDSDETTCIPTEIIYSKENKKNAQIHFTDGHIESTPCNELGLKPYVHQEDNPDNKKGVKSIKIYRNNALLENGVTLVDLPGVGSLTSGNVTTTMDYIEKSAGAIFLLRTIPPITNSESIFIKSAWPLLGKVFFVQNQWNDETTEEVNDGREHSLIALNKIAKASKLNNSDIGIDIVNIYKALTAKVKDDFENVEKSGLNNLINKIIIFVKNWKEEVIAEVGKGLELKLDSTIINISQEIESLEKDSDLLKHKYQEEKNGFLNDLNKSKEKYRNIKSDIEDDESELNKIIRKTVKKSKENFRNSIRTTLDKGVATDGDKLERVFNDFRSEQVDVIFGGIEPLFEDFIVKINYNLEEISSFSFNKKSEKHTVGVEENTHWESLLSKGGGAIVGIGGAIGGAKAFGAIGGMFGGPIGLAVGVMLGGIVGAFIGGKVGSEGEKAILKSRADDAKKVVFPLIDKWAKELQTNLQNQLLDMVSGIISSVDKWYDDIEGEFNEREHRLNTNLNMGENEKNVKLEEMRNDMIELDGFKELLNTSK